VFEGAFLLALYLFRNKVLEKAIGVICILRESRAANQYDYNAASSGEEISRLIDLVYSVTVLLKTHDFSWSQSIG
jgi:hypothetical protein